MNRMKQALRALRLAAFLLVIWAVVEQLRRPAGERTWRGTLLGFVPYDFRRPTVARIKAAFWNPLDPHLFTARPLGVGWAINLYEVRRRLAACCQDTAAPADGAAAPPPAEPVAA